MIATHRQERTEGRGRQSGPAVLVLCLAAVVVVTGCATPEHSKLDPAIRTFADRAAAAYHAGDVKRADALWQKALQRAQLTDNRGEIVRNAYNLGLCRIASGRHADAEGLLKQAEALACGEGVELSRIILAQAELARTKGAAADSAKLAINAVAAGADREGQVQAKLLQGEAEYAGGRLQTALDCYKGAVSASSDHTAPQLMARMDELALRMVETQALPGDAAAILVSQAGWLKKAGQYKGMALTLARAADRYEKDSKWKQAFDCLIRAAQSLIGAEQRDQAKIILARASTLTDKTGNAADKALLSELMGKLK